MCGSGSGAPWWRACLPPSRVCTLRRVRVTAKTCSLWRGKQRAGRAAARKALLCSAAAAADENRLPVLPVAPTSLPWRCGSLPASVGDHRAAFGAPTPPAAGSVPGPVTLAPVWARRCSLGFIAAAWPAASTPLRARSPCAQAVSAQAATAATSASGKIETAGYRAARQASAPLPPPATAATAARRLPLLLLRSQPWGVPLSTRQLAVGVARCVFPGTLRCRDHAGGQGGAGGRAVPRVHSLRRRPPPARDRRAW